MASSYKVSLSTFVRAQIKMFPLNKKYWKVTFVSHIYEKSFQKRNIHWRVMLITEPEFSVKVSESNFVVFPISHKVFFRFNVISELKKMIKIIQHYKLVDLIHISFKRILSLPDLKDHPTSSFSLQIAIDLPRTLGQVRRMNQVNSTLGCTLVSLDVMTR